MDCFIIRYGEIALKGKNRAFFETTLEKAIVRSLNYFGVSFSEIKRKRGRIILFSKEERAIEVLKKVFGIVSFSPAIEVKLDLNAIIAKAIDIVEQQNRDLYKETVSFRVTTNRVDKTFPKTSQEINEILGEAILKRFSNLKVSLTQPELEIGIELHHKHAYVYTEKYKGAGGLPVPSSGTVYVLLSGGIDSPVAAYQIMKRGCNVHLLHFYNEFRAHSKIPQKIKKIYYKLKEYNPLVRLILVPFSQVEKEIVKKSPSSYRIILLRILFLRYIEEKLSGRAVVTGDNLGQVASQTLDNLNTISSFSSLLVMRPLISFDKQEIIKIAKRIQTYELSIEPYEDCCSLLLSKYPATHARPEEIKRILERFDIKQSFKDINPIYVD